MKNAICSILMYISSVVTGVEEEDVNPRRKAVSAISSILY